MNYNVFIYYPNYWHNNKLSFCDGLGSDVVVRAGVERRLGKHHVHGTWCCRRRSTGFFVFVTCGISAITICDFAELVYPELHQVMPDY